MVDVVFTIVIFFMVSTTFSALESGLPIDLPQTQTNETQTADQPTVTITGEDGVVLGSGSVDAGGRYEITLRSAQTDGERVEAVQSDAAGNVSGNASTIAPDFTAPAQPVAAINAIAKLRVDANCETVFATARSR